MKLPSLSTALSILMIILVCAPLAANSQSVKSETETAVEEAESFSAPFEGDGTRIVVFDDQIILFKRDEKSECEGAFCRYDILVNQIKVFNLQMKIGQVLNFGRDKTFFLPSTKPLKFNFSLGTQAKDVQAEYSLFVEYQVGANGEQPDCLMPDYFIEIPTRKGMDRVWDTMLTSPSAGSCFYAQFSGSQAKRK